MERTREVLPPQGGCYHHSIHRTDHFVHLLFDFPEELFATFKKTRRNRDLLACAKVADTKCQPVSVSLDPSRMGTRPRATLGVQREFGHRLIYLPREADARGSEELKPADPASREKRHTEDCLGVIDSCLRLTSREVYKTKDMMTIADLIFPGFIGGEIYRAGCGFFRGVNKARYCKSFACSTLSLSRS